jgi:hypothetical protein
MTTISVRLTDLVINAYFEAPLLLEEILVTDGTGLLTITLYPPFMPPAPAPFYPLTADPNTATPSSILMGPLGNVRFHLQIDTGTRVNALRLGQLVTIAGADSDKKPFYTTVILETTNTGTPALFSGPMNVPPWRSQRSAPTTPSMTVATPTR